MRIGIISDTHNQQRSVCQAIEIFKAQGVECILHAGDITGPATISLFAQLPGSRLIAVFGNCDSERSSLRSAVEAVGGEIHDPTYTGQIDGRAVYMTHIPNGIDQVIRSGKHDLVVYGHTHQQNIRTIGKTLVINPGAARNWMGQASHVVIVDLTDMTATTESLG